MIKSEKITIFAYLKLFLINNSLKNDLFHIKIWPKITEKWPFLASEIPEFPDFQYRNSVLSSIPEYRNSVLVLDALVIESNAVVSTLGFNT